MRRFSSADDAVMDALRRRGVPWEDVAIALDRAGQATSCKKRAKKINLDCLTTYRPFTAEEDLIIDRRRREEGATWDAIAAEIGRPAKGWTVLRRALRMRLPCVATDYQPRVCQQRPPSPERETKLRRRRVASWKAIEDYLEKNRPTPIIEQKAKELPERVAQPANRQRHRYTMIEDSIIARMHLQGSSLEEIAKAINRPGKSNAVKIRAGRLRHRIGAAAHSPRNVDKATPELLSKTPRQLAGDGPLPPFHPLALAVIGLQIIASASASRAGMDLFALHQSRADVVRARTPSPPRWGRPSGAAAELDRCRQHVASQPAPAPPGRSSGPSVDPMGAAYAAALASWRNTPLPPVRHGRPLVLHRPRRAAGAAIVAEMREAAAAADAAERRQEMTREPAQIYLTGTIGNGPSDTIRPDAIRRFFGSVRKFQTVKIRLDTRGGYLVQARQICDLIRLHGGRVHIHVSTHCDSAGLLLLSSASVRSAAPTACFTFHDAGIDPPARRLNAATLRDWACEMDRDDAAIAGYLAGRCRAPVAWIANLCRNSTRLNAHQARSLGLVHVLTPG